ncbi:MAG: hypothetical protein LBV23_11875 [Deltaproteobacteria bacterium]|jgi:type III secretion system chaperone SycN|nr:hypothetical protein [Deltaproteobacteria bacterium]
MSQTEAVADFGRRVGLGSLSLGQKSSVSLELTGLGRLSIESSADDRGDLIVSLSKELPPYDHQSLLKALEECSPTKANNLPICCGFQGDRLVIISRVENRTLSGPVLQSVVKGLIKIISSLDSQS